MGKRTKKVVPNPSSLSTVIVPLGASTTSLTILVPSPVPVGVLLVTEGGHGAVGPGVHVRTVTTRGYPSFLWVIIRKK